MKEFLETPRVYTINKKRKWFPSDTRKQYFVAKEKFKIVYGPDDIEYKFNNKGFRCDNFEDCTNHPYRILFAGCSMTEGIGLPLEHTWAKIMHKKICKNLKIKIPFWSIAAGGSGVDHMVRYLYHEGDILCPQIIISNLPDIRRREYYASDLEITGHDDWLKLDSRYVKYQTEKNFAFINTLLEKWNSYFIFVTYNPDFDISYMNLSRIKQYDMFHIDGWDFARDGMHAGPSTNKKFADNFFKIALPLIEEKLNVNRI